jgi:ribosomal protein S12 methylthiotransferase accessory factor
MFSLLDVLSPFGTAGRPRVRPHYRVHILRGEGAYLLSEGRQVALEGELFELLCPWLDGRCTVARIVEGLEGKLRPAAIYYGIELLRRSGHLVDMEGCAEGADDAWWSAQGLHPAQAEARLQNHRVSLRAATEDVSVAALRDALTRDGVRVEDGGDLLLVAVEDYLDATLAGVNRECLQAGRRWAIVRLNGNPLLIGPVFLPGDTGCWECLAQRLRMNREYELVIGGAASISAGTRRTKGIGASLASAQIAEWIAKGGSSKLDGRVLSMNVLTWETATHELIRQPYCRACGGAADLDQAARPIELRACVKQRFNDGGQRSVSAEETLRRYSRHVSPITGVVRVIHRKDVADCDRLHVYEAGTNRATPPHTLAQLRAHLRTNSLGKGTTEAQAKAGALCEAIERYSGGFQGYEPRRVARMFELGEQAVDPRSCMLYSEAQYRQREWWNAKKSRFNVVPKPFVEDAVLDWSPLWSLSRNTTRYLPSAMLYYGHPTPRGELMFTPCSNGAAAGNTMEEAILQGLVELIERDSLALWWYNRVQRPGVDLESFDDPFMQQLDRSLKAHGRDLWAIDLTSDLQIPVFGAFSRRVEAKPERIIMGFGAHLDVRIALLRALTELTQMLAWILPEERNDPNAQPILDEETTTWLATAESSAEAYLRPLPNVERRFAHYPTLPTEDLRDDVLFCRSVVECKGMEVLVLDQTRPDIGLPVAKVVVPGLRHCHARFGPGRLYDIPLELGWQDNMLSEAQLNPISVFL